ncbi:peptidoglycan/xylan/chitin deacetylase (PgdA/CDA1 family) [Mycobacterium frederiksbergense]|uniref:Peptidoglycan/xylan/chitin deacetylase (PgdA/CDA1 family) n=1 Tax=Mycolicibacterium frederiksbergense TaxID=117567 RepID=A0ABT6KZ01_9MYCO|nr:polysaccharide deacetylase [Mycolicibacterium frederiksbergense]MDH6195922.1 peptidoglycan/xylan/chitin deacetylase (PgdA/CDA1 family) [Mycolicibacterium frederiksbergense]
MLPSTRDVLPLVWPGQARAALALTFDVDAEVGWLCEGEQYQRRLTTLSEVRFGITRGLPRILEMLSSLNLPATFFVPGATAERYPAAVAAIVEGGHEVAHHGHDHLRSDKVDAHDQRVEIERALEVFESLGVRRPTGYRSPAWELTPETFDLLHEFDFQYDSSCMGDDRPYYEEYQGKSLLELPVHWSLDDWPRFGWNIDTAGVLGQPSDLRQEWNDELELAVEEGGRVVIPTMHPEMIGRGYRFVHLRRWVESIAQRSDVWIATMSQIATHVRNSEESTVR